MNNPNNGKFNIGLKILGLKERNNVLTLLLVE